MTKVAAYDSAKFLDTPASIEFYMQEALESGDAKFIVHALGVVARARSMAEVARKSGLGRESLYKALSQSGSPEFSTVLRVLDALDLKLTIKPRSAKAIRPSKARVARKRRSADAPAKRASLIAHRTPSRTM